MTADASCLVCLGYEWVCEEHSDKPWSGVAGDAVGCESDCAGPGMPCQCSSLFDVEVESA